MKDRSRDGWPTLRAALAAFAVLLNILMPGGWALAAAPADPLAGGVILCLASGGTTTAPAAPDRSRAPSPENRGHCPVCPVPAASMLPPPFDNASASPVRYARITDVRADILPPPNSRHPATRYPRGPPA